MLFKSFTLLGIASVAIAHGNHDQEPMEGPHQSLWYNRLPGDGGTQVSTYKRHDGEHCANNCRPTLSSQALAPSDASPTSLV
jgi:hypothetical protein